MDLVGLVVSLGVPVLAALFFFEGLVIGKILQPPAIFVGYVTVVGPDWSTTLLIGLLCVLAATGGQWTLFRGFNDESPEVVGIRRTIPYLESLPERVRTAVSDRQLAFVQRQFDAYGATAICLTNAVPVVRGVVPIVAGINRYSVRRFLVASTAGNCLYVLALFAAAWGVSGVASVFGV